MAHSDPKIIPLTPIATRYGKTKDQPEAERLEEAKRLALNPAPLAEDFAESVGIFEAAYDRREEAFFPARRDPPPPKILRTEDVAWHLWAQHTLTVTDSPELDADYVDYEIVATRTTGGARFDDEVASSAKSALRLDLLLANRADRTPIIAEVKVKRDKDPYTALIQLLASVAHLATRSQYQRLRSHFPDAGFADQPLPIVDGYIVLYQFGMTKSTYLKRLLEQAEEICAALMSRPEMEGRLRRLVCLDLKLERGSRIEATCRWSNQS